VVPELISGGDYGHDLLIAGGQHGEQLVTVRPLSTQTLLDEAGEQRLYWTRHATDSVSLKAQLR
jgi:hypothetical protein